jgi:hypothetical protein
MKMENKVTLKNAVLAYSPKTDFVKVYPYLKARIKSNAPIYTVLAVGTRYDELNKNGKIKNVLVESLQAIIRDEVDPISLLAEIVKIPEIENLFSDDTLYVINNRPYERKYSENDND